MKFLLTLLLLCSTASAAEIYRWTDEQGALHFGDRPRPEAERVELGPLHRWWRVESVPDGDTLHLAGGEKVRLIGVNTPEVEHRDSPAEPGGDEAAVALRQRLAGKRVRLEPGPERHDRYGRLLAHVFDEAGGNVNAWLLREGLGHASPRPPNTTRAAGYAALEEEARTAGRGIWALPEYQVLPAAEALGHRGHFRRLEGTVKELRRGRRWLYLELEEGLTAYLEGELEPTFAEAGHELAQLPGRRLVLRGWVRKRDGRAMVRLRHPLQIERVQ